MRFDGVNAVYALFGQFFISVRLPIEKLSGWLGGACSEQGTVTFFGERNCAITLPTLQLECLAAPVFDG
jgi:hypothetical protein